MSNTDRSLDQNPHVRGGREKRWPLALDYHDPEQVASFCLSLGYDRADVLNTVIEHCNLDRITARSIVDDVADQLQGGTHGNHS